MKIAATLFLALLASCSQKVYVVRHAEKLAPQQTEAAIDPSNPPLSPVGEGRAQVLKRKLSNKMIREIYATKYDRTRMTAQPLADALGLEVQIYGADPAGHADLMEKIFKREEGNIMVVGHSNTIDDLVNALTGSKTLSDLGDQEYNNLFILSRKKGSKTMKLKRKKYGN